MFLLKTTPKVFEKLAQHFLGMDGLMAHALATSKDTSKRSAAATEIVQMAPSPYALVNTSIFSAKVIKRTRKACGYLDAEDDPSEGAEDDGLEDADDELGQLSPKLVQQCLVLSRWEQVSCLVSKTYWIWTQPTLAIGLPQSGGSKFTDLIMHCPRCSLHAVQDHMLSSHLYLWVQDFSGCDDDIIDDEDDDMDSRSAIPDVAAASITNSSSNNSKVQVCNAACTSCCNVYDYHNQTM